MKKPKNSPAALLVLLIVFLVGVAFALALYRMGQLDDRLRSIERRECASAVDSFVNDYFEALRSMDPQEETVSIYGDYNEEQLECKEEGLDSYQCSFKWHDLGFIEKEPENKGELVIRQEENNPSELGEISYTHTYWSDAEGERKAYFNFECVDGKDCLLELSKSAKEMFGLHEGKREVDVRFSL